MCQCTAGCERCDPDWDLRPYEIKVRFGDTFSMRGVTVFLEPEITEDRRPRVGKYGPKWGNK
jgi:hypothetical protein